jgi:TPP-dependent pyruvate/acetoin dehydrogenase alpha subunit
MIQWMRDAAALHEADVTALEGEIAAEVEAAVAFAEQGSWEPVEHLTRDVYAEAGHDA